VRSAARIGLVAIGNVSQSFIFRLSSLHARLGPVKGVSFPSARRLVVSLGSGSAVAKYSDLESCSAIWVVAPEARLDDVIRDMTAETPIHKTIFVVCGTPRESTSFEPLRSRGARVATLSSVDEVWQTSFIAEGHRDALLKIREILFKDKRRCIELDCGAKAKYLAGVNMVTELLRPWASAAVELMSAAGLSRSEASTLSESLASRSLRAYSKVGIKIWPPGAKRALKEAQRRVEQLRPQCPREAQLYAEGLRLALEYFDRGSPKNAASESR
jgi:hypothetical protein